MRGALIATAVATTLLGMSYPAHALGPLAVEVAGEMGGGTNPFSTDPNALGLGVGGRAGASFLGIYAGLRALYYFGGTKAVMLGSPAQVETRSALYGVEVGYGIRIADVVTIRPQVGVGSYVLSDTVGGTQIGSSTLYLEPAVAALVAFKPLILGLDAGALTLPGFAVSGTTSRTYAAFTAHGQLGVVF
jgi:hypothetical protein